MSALEDALAMHIRAHKLPEPVREYPFAKAIGRRWRFDFAWPDLRVAAEVEGGIYSGGRHTRGKGFERDAEKYNQATVMGWDVVRFSAGMIRSGKAVETIRTLLDMKARKAG